MRLGSSVNRARNVDVALLRPGEAVAVELAEGEAIRIITLGGQTSDLSFAGLSQSITRESCGVVRYGKVRQVMRLKQGDEIYDSNYVATLRITGSSTRSHDVLWPGCSAAMYRRVYNVERRGCRDLLREVLGIKSSCGLEVVSFFMNVGYGYEILPSRAKRGDFVELMALRQVTVGITACPDGFLANPTPSGIKVIKMGYA